MIVICPQCSKRYMLDESLIPERGRHVRCSECQTTWLHKSISQQPMQNSLVLDEIQDTLSQMHESKIKKNRNGTLYLFAAILFLLGLIIFGREYFVRFFPESERYYELIGLPVNAKLSSLKVSARSSLLQPSKKEKMIQVEGKVINTSERVRGIPPLKIKLLDPNSHVVDSWEHLLSETSLLPGEQVHFQTEPRKRIKEANHVTVEF